MSIQIKLATTAAELRDVYRLRYQVYVETEGVYQAMKDNQASSTAFTVLQGILHIAQSSPFGYLVDDEVVRLGRKILAANSEGRKRLQQLNSRWFSLSVKLREWLILPGITLHYVLRKRHVEEQTHQCIAGGVTPRSRF